MTTAVVTGASGGIGREIVRRLLAEDFEVIGIDKDSRPPQMAHVDYTHHILDLADQVALQALSDGLPDNVGLLVHAAAVQPIVAAGTGDAITWASCFLVNVVSLELLTAYLRTRLVSNAPHLVLSIGSIHEILTSRRMAAYSVSKSALAAWVRAAALDLAPDVHVVNVAPGATWTPMLRVSLERNASPEEAREKLEASVLPARLIEPQEIANFCVELLAAPLAHLSGSTIRVDGGASTRLPGE